MPATQGPLIYSVYAPGLAGDYSRTLAVIHALERGLPSVRLAWTLSDEGTFIPLPQRDAWLAQNRREGGFPLLCNGDETCLVTLSGRERPAGLSPGGQSQFQVHAELPLDTAGIAAAANVLEGISEGSGAFWGCATPDGAALDIALQTSPTSGGTPCPPRGLPALKLFEDIRAPELPYFLGWLNFWSAASARAIGFPDPARDTDLLSRARRTTKGGWVVRLTDAPLDLDTPAHLEALLRAYERFPEIGGRSSL